MALCGAARVNPYSDLSRALVRHRPMHFIFCFATDWNRTASGGFQTPGACDAKGFLMKVIAPNKLSQEEGVNDKPTGNDACHITTHIKLTLKFQMRWAHSFFKANTHLCASSGS